MDQCVLGAGQALLVHEELLEKLLTGAQARVLDHDVNIRRVAGEADQVARHVVDAHRIAHIEDEDLSAAGVVGCLQHEGYGLGDCHEVADDILVGDGHRASGCDLLLEERNHTAVAPENVSETDRNKIRPGVLAVHHLNDHLAETLGRAHDVGRVDCLVGGDQDELAHLVRGGGRRGLPGADDVVLDRLVRAVLHQRHMLVRCRVIDDVRPVLAHHMVDAGCVAHGTDQRHEVELGVIMLQLLLDIICVIFIYVKYNQFTRMRLGDLAAELAADRSAAPCDEDGLARDSLKDLVVVDLDLGAAQQVDDLHLAELADADLAVHELVNPRYGLELAARILADIQDLFSVLCVERRDRKNNMRDTVLLCHLRNHFASSDDRYALEHTALFVFVVIDDADNPRVDLITVLQLLDQHLPGCPGADNHIALLCLYRLHEVRRVEPEYPV